MSSIHQVLHEKNNRKKGDGGTARGEELTHAHIHRTTPPAPIHPPRSTPFLQEYIHLPGRRKDAGTRAGVHGERRPAYKELGGCDMDAKLTFPERKL